MIKYKCKICENIEFDSYTSLSRHMGRTHNVSVDQSYVDYHLKGIWPTCKCGCGERMKYSYALKNFREYVKGHYSRVHNNWGHNQSAIDKSLQTRIKRFNSGELTTWNHGLTKETDERVKDNGIATSNAFSQDRKDRYSNIMRANRLNGTVPTLKGKDHSQWKGGVSSINVLVRARTRLYSDWKFPILSRDGFKCVTCSNTQNLHVHHDKETMSEIVAKHMVDKIDDMPFELKEAIADKVVDYHINNKVSGITLCGKCHNDLHPSLNFNID